MADAYFINEPVAHMCGSEPDAKSDYGILAEFQIASGIKLMRLLVRGQQVGQRAEVTVILQAQIQPLIQCVTQAHAWLNIHPSLVPGPLRARSRIGLMSY